MRNMFLPNENDSKPSFALRWRQEVQWRSLAASAALVAVFIAAPLSRWNSVHFQSTVSGANVEAPFEVQAVEVLPKRTGARATSISNISSINVRCSEMLARARTGEALSEQNRAFVQEECQ
jgi:hypothetical protein